MVVVVVSGLVVVVDSGLVVVVDSGVVVVVVEVGMIDVKVLNIDNFFYYQRVK